MKKKLLFFLFSLLFLVPPFTKEVRADCFYIGNAGYATCTGNVNARRCPGSTGSYYACCNQAGDVCPAEITAPVEANPAPPNPNDDPNCGATSQPCCGSSTCDNSQLTCINTAAGSKCLGQAQIDLLPGGSGQTQFGKSGQSDPTCENKTGILTAIGCIHVLSEAGPEAFLGDILRWAVGVGGGIAFLLIVYASFMIMTSSGNPERLKAGQELLTSAISGLILLILSIFILRFIGVDILKLPGFGQSP